MNLHPLIVGENCEVVLTPEMLAILRASPGKKITVRIEQNELVLTQDVDDLINQARGAFSGNRSLEDELYATRRDDAIRVLQNERYRTR